MRESAEPRLVEVRPVMTIYADDIGKVTVEGTNVRITFIEYRTIKKRRVRVPVIDIIRPIQSIRAGNIAAMIAEALKPTTVETETIRDGKPLN